MIDWKEDGEKIDFILNNFIIHEGDMELALAIQPNLFLSAGLLVAKMKNMEQWNKWALEEVKARISLDVRTNPEKYNLIKITEDTIKSVVDIHHEVIQCKNDYLASKYKLDIAEMILSAVFSRAKIVEEINKIRTLKMQFGG